MLRTQGNVPNETNQKAKPTEALRHFVIMKYLLTFRNKQRDRKQRYSGSMMEKALCQWLDWSVDCKKRTKQTHHVHTQEIRSTVGFLPTITRTAAEQWQESSFAYPCHLRRWPIGLANLSGDLCATGLVPVVSISVIMMGLIKAMARVRISSAACWCPPPNHEENKGHGVMHDSNRRTKYSTRGINVSQRSYRLIS